MHSFAAVLLVSLTSLSAFAGDEPFTPTIECQYRCTGEEKPHLTTFKQTFSPVQRGLRRGNGNFWGVLGWNLWVWGREWCLEKAVNECSPKEGKESQVADFALLGLSSRKWEVREAIDCRDRKHNIPSPFWKGLKPADQKILQDAIDAGIRWQNTELARQEKELVDSMKAGGMTVVAVDVEQFRKPVVDAVVPKFESRWGKGTYEKLQQMK